jgi:hypothetical protein
MFAFRSLPDKTILTIRVLPFHRKYSRVANVSALSSISLVNNPVPKRMHHFVVQSFRHKMQVVLGESSPAILLFPIVDHGC